ncbi:MAG: type II toxin-antitoxin system RelE/ParE family toxin [Bacteroidetes bacterium]|nr:MAG: type II toxin-antitoxin system RelE/ParE family toxin [Bacteroidota bacterium]
MNFSFHPEAEAEFNGAVKYYEDIEQVLGFDFATEVYSTIQHIVSLPKAWPIIEMDIHRCLVNRFPYGVLYSVEDNEIYIVAIMHFHRHPDYWKHRMFKI